MDKNLQTARKYLRLFGRGDFDGAARLMQPRAVVRWPNTREVFFGRDKFIEANRRYPGKWRFSGERLEKTGQGAVSAAMVWSPGSRQSFHVVSFYGFRGGLISTVTEYWGRDGQPPAWRRRGGWARRY
jgi:ketosteroid isomerase-like protein